MIIVKIKKMYFYLLNASSKMSSRLSDEFMFGLLPGFKVSSNEGPYVEKNGSESGISVDNSSWFETIIPVKYVQNRAAFAYKHFNLKIWEYSYYNLLYNYFSLKLSFYKTPYCILHLLEIKLECFSIGFSSNNYQCQWGLNWIHLMDHLTNNQLHTVQPLHLVWRHI